MSKSAKILESGFHYSTFATEVVQLIVNSDCKSKIEALSIWTYIQGQSDNWEVRRDQVCSILGCSKRKFANAMKLLSELGLAQLEAGSRKLGGFFSGSKWSINMLPRETPPKIDGERKNEPPVKEPDCDYKPPETVELEARDTGVSRAAHLWAPRKRTTLTNDYGELDNNYNQLIKTDSSSPVIVLPMENDKKLVISQLKLNELKFQYQSVDVFKELYSCGLWLISARNKWSNESMLWNFVHKWLLKNEADQKQKLSEVGA